MPTVESPIIFSISGRKSVHNLWVLPGHILVSLDEGKRLLSFDLLPKPKPWPEIVTLLPRQEDKKRKGMSLVRIILL